MLESEREAKRLMSDPSSWSQGGIKKKAYRQMALTPEEEVPRHKASRKKKPKHVHKWGEWIKVGETTRRPWVRGKSGNFKRGREYVMSKWVRTCKKCGHRDKGESVLGGEIKRSHYWL